MDDRIGRWPEAGPLDRLETRKGAIVCAAAAALASAAAYANTLDSPFVYDDLQQIVLNTSIRDLSRIDVIFRGYPSRPLTNFTYALDYAAAGLVTVPYHVTNVVLHVLNVLLVFVLVRHLAGRYLRDVHGRAGATLLALLVACLLGVHPLMTEAVAFVSSRAELLASACFLGTILLFAHGLGRAGLSRVVLLAGGVLMFLLALAAKETAVVLPATLWALDRFVLRPDPAERRRRFWRLHLPLSSFVVLAAAARIWLYLAVEHSGAGIQWSNILLELHVLQRYVQLLFVPAGLSLIPPVSAVTSLTDVRVLTGTATLALLLGTMAYTRKRQPLVTFGLAWFLVILAPSAALLVINDMGHAMAEHRVYLPSVGFFLAVAVGTWQGLLYLFRFHPRTLMAAQASLAIAIVMLSAVFFVFTVERNEVWASPVRLWTDAVRKAPNAWMAHYGLAQAYRSEEDCLAAADVYRRAIAIRPSEPRAYIGLAGCLMDQGRPAEAREQLRISLYRAPADVDAGLALAAVESAVFDDWRAALAICRELAARNENDGRVVTCVRTYEAKLRSMPAQPEDSGDAQKAS